MQIENCNPFDSIFTVEGTVREENNSKIRIETKDNYFLVKVDKGLLISKKDQKCDYLILNCDKLKTSYVELKGRNLKDGAVQIMATHDHLKSRLVNFNKFEAIIVVSYFDKNELKSTKVVALERKLKSILIKKTKVYIYR